MQNGIANSEDPDQTAPLGAVRSGSALFAQSVCPVILDHYGSDLGLHYLPQLVCPKILDNYRANNSS